MNIDQLQYFYLTAKLLSFSKAAVTKNITQSALSKQIASLEKELDIKLFDRSHRNIQLTSAGAQLMKDAKVLLKDYDMMIRHLKAQKLMEENTLHIAMLPLASHFGFMKQLKAFEKQNPNIRFVLREIDERDLDNGRIHLDDYDIFILRGNMEPLINYHHKRLYQDTLTAVLSKHHPLAKQTSIDMTQLKGENMLIPPPYSAIACIFEEACHNAGFKPQISRRGRVETLITMAQEKEGIAITVERSLSIFHLHDVVALPFREPIPADVMLYYATSSPFIHSFIAFMSDNI